MKEKTSPSVPLIDTRIPLIDAHAVQLWHFTGAVGVYYPTKMAAEIAARQMFPDETEDKRYARISYSNFVKEG